MVILELGRILILDIPEFEDSSVHKSKLPPYAAMLNLIMRGFNTALNCPAWGKGGLLRGVL